MLACNNISNTYKIKLIEKIKRTPTILSLRFSLSLAINFIPGQFLKVIFDESNYNNKELNKNLSFSSSPLKDYIEITKRLSESAFSQRLEALGIGDEICIQGPFGRCTFSDNHQKIAFLIGGIGITPVISILEYIQDKNLKTDALLFYSNRTEEEISFKEELNQWQAKNSNFKVFYTVTYCQPKDKNCLFGRIDKELVSRNIKDISERIFFIFGPPKMVEAMKELCLAIGAKEEFIKTESFLGY
ncbi:MAG: hypothetical protein A2166_05800 [Omnitrophica WOR_2 bacterium RBG_13_41_10]|nr:MAG: hypothetical protein A2166_05800 [Omnitrophica WOR_2 bacterium RBG_13_41_10]